MRRIATILAVLGASATASAGHPIGVKLTAEGLDFLEQQVGKFLPTAFYPEDVHKTAFGCPGDDATVNQVGSAVAVHLDNLDLSLPSPGRIRIDATITGQLSGELHLTKVAACAGSINCFDRVLLRGVRITAELGVAVSDAVPAAQLFDLDVIASSDDLEVEIYECGLVGSVATTVVDKVKDAVFDQLLAYGNDLAMQKLPPMLDEVLAGVGSLKFNAAIPQASVSASLETLDVQRDGIELRAEVDGQARGDMNVCNDGFDDPGEPAEPSAAIPALAQNSHLGLAVSASLLNEAIYQVWRAGFMCVTDDLLALVGVELDPDAMGALLPGIPLGTRMSFGVRFEKPPFITFHEGDGAIVELAIPGMVARIDLVFPDGERHTIDATVDATAAAQMRLVPGANVMTMRMMGATIHRLDVKDETGADALGMDFGRLRTLLQEQAVPAVGDMLGEVPLTGAVFGGFEGMYVLLRELETTDDFLVAGVDLYAAPEDDTTAPETMIIDRPGRPVKPADAIVTVGGTDAEIPAELLQFEITAGGRRQDPTFLHELKVGKPGESGVYQIEVRAIDLEGNTDGTPARTEVTVDGIPPNLVTKSAPRGGGYKNPTFSWDMDDDMTAAGSLVPRIEIYKINGGDFEQVDVVELSPGTTEATLTLEDGTYRTVLVVQDGVGNEASDSRIFSVGDGMSGGCAVGGPGGAGGAVSGGGGVLLALALLALRRRGK